MVKARPIADLDANAPTQAACAPVLAVRIDDLFARAESARDPADLEALHDLRIAGKRLRYALEGFAPCLGAELDPALRQLTALQDQLGAIHDLDIACDLVRDELRRALRRLRRSRKRLAAHTGTGVDELLVDIDALARALREGEAAGLLDLLRLLVQRRHTQHAEFVAAWDDAAAPLRAGLRALLHRFDSADG